MTDPAKALASLIHDKLGEKIAGSTVVRDEVTIEVDPAHLLEVAGRLRDDPQLGFEQLIDVCGVDYSTYGLTEWETSEQVTSTGYSRGVERGLEQPVERAAPSDSAAVYHLLSISNNHRLRIRVNAKGEPPRVPSVVPVWAGANWFEREAFDLFGILFEGHPDLRRLLTDYGFIGHPFRKDYPLIGQVEMRYDPEKQRVVYEPVSIEPRVLVPRVIRHDHRYEHGAEVEEADDA